MLNEKPKYDATTGKLLKEEPKPELPVYYLILGVIVACLVPIFGIIAGLYAIYKKQNREAVILLFVSVIAWIVWIGIIG